jgi:hypothetical protein
MTKTVVQKKGRPPRAGVRRYTDGSILRADRRPAEDAEDIKATVLEARLRQEGDEWLSLRGSPKAMREARRRMDDPLRGYALGRLLIKGRKDPASGVTKIQHDAGEYFIRLYRARAKISGWPSPNLRAIDYGAVSGGLSTHPEESPGWVADVKRRWEALNQRIYDMNSGDVYAVLKRVLIEDRDCEDLQQVGALRMGLNAIDRMMQGR